MKSPKNANGVLFKMSKMNQIVIFRNETFFQNLTHPFPQKN